MQNGAAALEHNLSVTQTVKHTVTVWSSNSTRSYIPKRIENICPHKNVYTNVHSSIIHNSQKGEATQISINWWMNK